MPEPYDELSRGFTVTILVVQAGEDVFFSKMYLFHGF